METKMLFTGRNQIPFWYSIYNAARSSGPHRGVDVHALDDDRIVCPVAGTVARATVITSKADPTWEWGYYVRVDDAKGNRHYFCHCLPKSFCVAVGQKISAGTVLARMGCSGNAALAAPPIAHVHYEVRSSSGKWLNPCSFLTLPNKVGVFGTDSKRVRINTPSLRVRTGPATDYGIVHTVKAGEEFPLLETKSGWGYVPSLGGWLSLSYTVPV